jgi:LuxR family maltose regulon positive regulatory protein
MSEPLDTEQLLADFINAGREALAQGDWQEAHRRFEAALALGETPEALEGFGMAAWWLDEFEKSFDARERAYRLYRERGDRHAAARMATALGLDYVDIRGEPAIANGWFRRARRLLDGLGPSPEHGWLTFYEGMMAFQFDKDTVMARKLNAEAAELARSLGLLDLEMLTVAAEGLILVREGQVAAGMQHLDEASAAVIAGEMTDLNAIGNACCLLIYACESVADYERAAQWCDRMEKFCARWRLASLLAVCRSYYAAVLLWRGAWSEAEAELTSAMRELEMTRPDIAAEGMARLAELRLRQGKLAEAEELLEKADPHPMTLLGRAALALEHGDAVAVADLVERFLRRISPEDRAERVFALELLARAQIFIGALGDAASAIDEMKTIASSVGTDPLLASASFAEGLLSAARNDHEGARRCLEDAVDSFKRSGALFETAQARIELGKTLRTLGRHTTAAREAQTALEYMERLGAILEARRAASLLFEMEPTARGMTSEEPHPAGLTSREVEVLRLIAAGKSNQEIAAELVLSVRTVERHISTIYEKLGVSGKVARAAATAYAISHGLIQSS